MAVYALGEQVPEIDPEAWVHPEAVVIGSVRLGPGASVWPGAVLRGDFGLITVGPRTNIQDGAVLHVTSRYPTTIGADCVVGHLAHLEGCTVEDGCLIGTGSVVLHRVVVGEGALVAAAALVPGGKRVPPGALAMGVPAKILEGGSDRAEIARAATGYAANARRYRAEMRRID